jgi:hypothetical protein
MCEDLVSRKIAGSGKGEKVEKGGCYGKVLVVLEGVRFRCPKYFTSIKVPPTYDTFAIYHWIWSR